MRKTRRSLVCHHYPSASSLRFGHQTVSLPLACFQPTLLAGQAEIKQFLGTRPPELKNAQPTGSYSNSPILGGRNAVTEPGSAPMAPKVNQSVPQTSVSATAQQLSKDLALTNFSATKCTKAGSTLGADALHAFAVSHALCLACWSLKPPSPGRSFARHLWLINKFHE